MVDPYNIVHKLIQVTHTTNETSLFSIKHNTYIFLTYTDVLLHVGHNQEGTYLKVKTTLQITTIQSVH